MSFYFCRNVVKSFYTAGMLFDTLTVFGEISEDVRFYVAHSKYCVNPKCPHSNKCHPSFSPKRCYVQLPNFQIPGIEFSGKLL